MDLFISAVVAGLAIGSVYGMIAVCYTVVFNATSVFNVAQGDIVAVGVLLSWLCLNEAHLNQVLSLFIVIAGITVLSLLEERLVVRPFLKKDHSVAGIGVFIATLAFALVLETANSDIYGSRPLETVRSIAGQSPVRIGAVAIAPEYLLAFGALVVITIVLELFYRRSWLGTAMRACAEDREVAALRGIDPVRISRSAFLIAGIMAGIAGFVLTPIVSANVTVGLTYGLKGFIALAVGGFGSIRGSLIGAFLLGIAEQMFDLYGNANYDVLAGLGLLLLVLAVRPTGIFGSRAVRVV